MRRAAHAAAAALVLPILAVLDPTTTASAEEVAGTALPDGPDGMTAWQVSLADDDVYAMWGVKDTATSLYRTPADGTGSWQQVTVPSTGEPVTHVISLDDGVAVQYARRDGGACRRVVTTSTDWWVPGCDGWPLVGDGGQLVAVRAYRDGSSLFDVYGASAGAAGGVLTTTSSPPALAGTWVWTNGHRSLQGSDTLTGETVAVPLRDVCSQARTILWVSGDPHTTGSNALVRCGPRRLLVDLTGVTRPFDVTDRPERLGNGYLYDRRPGQDVLRVQDLSSTFAEHTLQDYRTKGMVWPQGPVWNTALGSSFAGSTSGTPRIAYLDVDDGVSVATLPALGSAPTPATDTTVPRILDTGGSPPVVRGVDWLSFDGTPLRFTWSGADDDAAGPSYDVQFSATGDDEPGWATVPGGDGTLETSVDHSAVTGQERVCFRVQAVDRAGNRSTWSAPRCTTIDGERPWMADGLHDTRRLRLLQSLGGRVVHRFSAQDDVRVASYDVQQRTTPFGVTPGRWSSPARSRGLTVRTYASAVAPGQERCFRARARDAVGRVSRYGDAWCVVAPADDRALALRGGTRLHSTGALGGTLTRLDGRGSSLSMRAATGRELRVLARTGSGCPRVRWGAAVAIRDDGCIAWPGPRGYSWFSAIFRRPQSGAVVISRGRYSHRTLVDAVIVLR